LTDHIFSVSEFTKLIKASLEHEPFFQNIYVKGEVSNVKSYAMGNQLYFTLKDETSQIRCVMFATSRLAFDVKDQMQVIARGKISVYEKRGEYSLQVAFLEPAGIGALALAFAQLKQKLLDEGLFEEARKRPIPLHLRKVAIITSPSGAVLHDILTTIRGRDPALQVYIIPAQVQGDAAAPSIVKALQLANTFGDLDAIILARGGGSVEELWGFNEERVARAIVASRIPVISAVGHETDFTIADFVADYRAPTPTAAAVKVSLPRNEYCQILLGLQDQLRQQLINQVQEKKILLSDFHMDLMDKAKGFVQDRRHNLGILEAKLEGFNPYKLIEKGYALVKKAGQVVRRAKDLQSGESFSLLFSDGSITAKVESLSLS